MVGATVFGGSRWLRSVCSSASIFYSSSLKELSLVILFFMRGVMS